MRKPQAGFTIVELLIVIVVIAILAAISITAYNGIQARAGNSTTMSGVAQYVKLFQMYATDNGEYPDTNGDYPCLDATLTSGCGRVSGSGGCGFSGLAGHSTSFFSQLSSYATQMPTISDQTMTCGGTEVYRGAYVENNTSNVKDLYFRTFLKGDVSCSGSVGAATLINRQWTDVTTSCRYRMPTL